MKYLIAFLVLLVISACTFHPIVDPRSPEVAAATQTARAESLLPTVTPEATVCLNVKGNIDASGRKLYHLPGMRNYNQVKIDPSKGEKLFCTEQDAIDAGWVKAGN